LLKNKEKKMNPTMKSKYEAFSKKEEILKFWKSRGFKVVRRDGEWRLGQMYYRLSKGHEIVEVAIGWDYKSKLYFCEINHDYREI
jgi:hypothetical protein